MHTRKAVVQIRQFFSWTLGGGEDPSALPPESKHVDPADRLDFSENSKIICLYRYSNRGLCSPLRCHYTNYATLASQDVVVRM